MDSFLGLYLDLCLDLCLGSLLEGRGFNSLHMPGGIIRPRQRKDGFVHGLSSCASSATPIRKKRKGIRKILYPDGILIGKTFFCNYSISIEATRGPRGISMCIILVYPIRILVNNGIPYLPPVIKQIINCKINVHSHYYYQNIHCSFRQLVVTTLCTTLNNSNTLRLLIVNAHRTTLTPTKPSKKH